MKKIILLAFFLCTGAACRAEAAAEKYIYDPAHTQIIFSVDHLGFSHPQGRFARFTGGFIFDAENTEKSSADVTINTDSLYMGSDVWEKVMKSDEFFNTEKFPDITFKSIKIEKTGDRTLAMTGNLVLLGITKPVTLDVTYNKSGVNPFNKNYTAGFSAVGTLKRSDFGMTFGLPEIGDDVTLNIQVEGIRQDFEKVAQ